MRWMCLLFLVPFFTQYTKRAIYRFIRFKEAWLKLVKPVTDAIQFNDTLYAPMGNC